MAFRSLKLPKLPVLDRLRQQWATRSPDLPEDSLLLRVLAQSLVLVGIVATDIAAETQMSLWAIPASIAGASWSWHRRRQRNIVTKFLLAIGMLVALAAFFQQMIFGRELNDTRLVLAELLVQIQVLHSFDLPRRKDLGYSMMIGLILLGVASTLSQTMAFGGMLLIFLAIGLPMLVMDYRAQLGFRGWSRSGDRRQKLSLGNLPWVFGLTLVLGLLIFALMPRLPGYQFRSFPMSAPIETQANFDNQRVINPGYVRDGGQGDRPGRRRGMAPSQGKGQLDEEFYYGFGERINQNLRGQLKPKVVMRVRSQAAGFWRVQAFDRYTGQGWEIAHNDQSKTVERSPWAYQFFLPRTVTLNKTKEVVQTYTMTADLPNVIPALTQPKELFFPTRQVAISPDGGLRSPVSLIEGMTYTVISEVPYRDRSVLQKARSIFPPVPNTPPNENLQIPPTIAAKVKQETERILATSPNPITSDYEKALYLAQYLKQRYALQQDLPFFDDQEDLVEAFLFKYKGGYRDHYSTTLTVMLRSIGMPARLITGFLPGEFNPFTGLYIVRNTDAYALTEVYFRKYGWFAFDPIPGHPLIPPSIEEDQTFTVLQRFWNWVAGWLPSPVTSFLNRIFGQIGAVLGRILGWIWQLVAQGIGGWLVLGIGTTTIGLLGWLAWQGWGQWRLEQRLRRLPPMERLYQQLLVWLAQQGYPKDPAQTPLEYAHHIPIQAASTVQAICAAYVQWRYGGRTIEVSGLTQQFRQLQQTHRQHRREQWMARWRRWRPGM